jgi:hypothetical protein
MCVYVGSAMFRLSNDALLLQIDTTPNTSTHEHLDSSKTLKGRGSLLPNLLLLFQVRVGHIVLLLSSHATFHCTLLLIQVHNQARQLLVDVLLASQLLFNRRDGRLMRKGCQQPRRMLFQLLLSVLLVLVLLMLLLLLLVLKLANDNLKVKFLNLLRTDDDSILPRDSKHRGYGWCNLDLGSSRTSCTRGCHGVQKSNPQHQTLSLFVNRD